MMECLMFKLVFSIFALATFVSFSPVHAQGNALQLNSVTQRANLAAGMTNGQGEEIVGRASGFSAVLTLDDANLQTLIRQGRVEIGIPQQLVNSVESVIVKRPVHFKNKKATDFADAELAGQKLVVNVDNSVIERIDYQPVELKVYETGFSSVVLNYVGDSSTSNASDPGDPKTDSPLMTIKLKSGNGITGRIVGMKQLKIDSELGMIEVAFDRTNQIKVKRNGELNIEMVNGDLISGKVDGNKIELINRWSTESIKLSDVAALIIRRPKKQTGQNTEQMRARVISPAGISARQEPQKWIFSDRGF